MLLILCVGPVFLKDYEPDQDHEQEYEPTPHGFEP